MAMIQCPKCGKEVSDSGTACPYCGYEFQKRENVSTVQNAPSKPKITDPALAWQLLCPQGAKRKKLLWVLQVFLGLFAFIPVVLLCLALFDVIQPMKRSLIGSNLQFYDNYNSFLNNIFTALIVLGLVFCIVRSIATYYKVAPISKWMAKNRFNVIPFLEEEDIMVTGKKADAYWAAYCVLSPKGKAVYALYSAINGVTGSAVIFIGVAFRELCLSRLEDFVAGIEWSVEMPWVYFIIGFGLLMFAMLIVQNCSKACKDYLTAYVAKNKTK